MNINVISSKDHYKDDDVYNDIVRYCLNPSKCRDGLVAVCNMERAHIARDMYRLSKKFGKLKGTRIRHVVLSFDSHDKVDPELAYCIAWYACAFYADQYQVFAAVHQNTDFLHIHMVMNTVNIYTGEKYRGKKKDYYDFQKHLKYVAGFYGIKFRGASK